MEGWIKIHRQIIENEFYFSERFTKQQAWVDLLLLARHNSGLVTIRGIDIKLNPGQLCYSQLSLSKRWQWDRKKVKKFLNQLKKREMVDIKISKVTTIISINNWSSYQGVDNKKDNRIPNNFPTNKNDKNDKKELIIAAAKYLITDIQEETSFYSIVNKNIKIFGEKKIHEILTGCINREKEFTNENRLAAYFEVCRNGRTQKVEDYDPAKSFYEGKDVHDIMKESGLIK